MAFGGLDILQWLLLGGGAFDFFRTEQATQQTNQAQRDAIEVAREAVGAIPERPAFDFGFGDQNVRVGPEDQTAQPIDLTSLFTAGQQFGENVPQFKPIEAPQVDTAGFLRGTPFETLLSQSGVSGLTRQAAERFPDLSAFRASQLGGLAERSAREEELGTQSILSRGGLEESRDRLEDFRAEIGTARGRAAGGVEAAVEQGRESQARFLGGLSGLEAQIRASLASGAARDATSRGIAGLGAETELAGLGLRADLANLTIPISTAATQAGLTAGDESQAMATMLGLSGQDVSRFGIQSGQTTTMITNLINAMRGLTLEFPSLAGPIRELLGQVAAARGGDASDSSIGGSVGFGPVNVGFSG